MNLSKVAASGLLAACQLAYSTCLSRWSVPASACVSACVGVVLWLVCPSCSSVMRRDEGIVVAIVQPGVVVLVDLDI